MTIATRQHSKMLCRSVFNDLITRLTMSLHEHKKTTKYVVALTVPNLLRDKKIKCVLSFGLGIGPTQQNK